MNHYTAFSLSSCAGCASVQSSYLQKSEGNTQRTSSLVMRGWNESPSVPLIMLHSCVVHQSSDLQSISATENRDDRVGLWGLSMGRTLPGLSGTGYLGILPTSRPQTKITFDKDNSHKFLFSSSKKKMYLSQVFRNTDLGTNKMAQCMKTLSVGLTTRGQSLDLCKGGGEKPRPQSCPLTSVCTLPTLAPHPTSYTNTTTIIELLVHLKR